MIVGYLHRQSTTGLNFGLILLILMVIVQNKDVVFLSLASKQVILSSPSAWMSCFKLLIRFYITPIIHLDYTTEYNVNGLVLFEQTALGKPFPCSFLTFNFSHFSMCHKKIIFHTTLFDITVDP